MTRVPFAVNQLGRYVEASIVPRGRVCNCYCPSCNLPVIARKGKQREPHFAHDSNPKNPPDKECELSFDVCCRQYLEQMMLSGEISSLQTPALNLEYHSGTNEVAPVKSLVARAQRIENISFQKSTYADLEIPFENYSLFVFISYHGRKEPSNPKGEAGLLELDISWVKLIYKSQGASTSLSSVLKHFVEERAEHKHWLYHPRMTSSSIMPTSSQNSQQDVHNQVKSASRPIETGQKYRCLKCDYRWTGSKPCPKCGNPSPLPVLRSIG